MKQYHLTYLLTALIFFAYKANTQKNYLQYHKKVIQCEQLIAQEQYNSAISGLDSLFDEFGFVFLREIKLATELSVYQTNFQSGFKFLRLGISNGWTIKSIKSNKNLKTLIEQPEWNKVESEYENLRQKYKSRVNAELRAEVYEMVKKDQKLALGAFIRIREKAKSKYVEKKFTPHSEQQMMQFGAILEKHGYPGEKQAGTNLWASIIISHHNSISIDYNSKDTLFASIKPKLFLALEKGEISPYELARMEDWRTAVLNDHNATSYGFIGSILNESELLEVDENRTNIGLRSIALRNKLIEIEQSTGLNLYLPKGWQDGKITVRPTK